MPIITLSDAGLQAHSWQWHLKNAIRDVQSLSHALQLELPDVATDFPLLVPQSFLARMERGNPDDPLLLQVLPRPEENHRSTHYLDDPLGEQLLTGETRGILQKYHGRVLIMTTGACAVNCRYCFRRHFPYQDHQPDSSSWQNILEHLRADQSIREVILSGGDPLAMNDQQLSSVIKSIGEIEHVDTVRFHTRLPVVIPQRVCDKLLDWLTAADKQVVFVLHINHPNEIDDDVTEAMDKLSSAGATLLNQSVLLSGINNSADVLSALSRRLFAAGILPYYLHLFDPVSGAEHFDVRQERSMELMMELTRLLPGYLVPRLVREVPGADAKQLLYRA